MKFHLRSFITTVILTAGYICARIWAPPVADALHEPLMATLIPLTFLSNKE